MSVSQEIIVQIVDLLSQANISQENLIIERCALGGNNRTFRVETSDGVFAAKKYFNHSMDSRDRLSAEFSFLSYAEKVANGMVPKPYVQNSEHKIALYEFIQGRQFQPNEITEKEMEEAIHFFRLLNDTGSRAQASLGKASEACFSVQEHLDLVIARIKQLQKISPDNEEMQAAKNYAGKLSDYLLGLIEEIYSFSRNEGIDLDSPLKPEQCCISPSDFGFHNALKLASGGICFLDFEYAGWDDPCKMVGDFFAQIAVPVPERFFEPFVQKTMSLFPQSEKLILCAKISRPVYQVKWCCIALNVFLPQHLERRKFANDQVNVSDLLRSQLKKVEHLLSDLDKRSCITSFNRAGVVVGACNRIH